MFVADMNADGYPDLLTANMGVGESNKLYLNTGTPSVFPSTGTASISRPGTGRTRDIVAADFNPRWPARRRLWGIQRYQTDFS